MKYCCFNISWHYMLDDRASSKHNGNVKREKLGKKNRLAYISMWIMIVSNHVRCNGRGCSLSIAHRLQESAAATFLTS